MAKKCILASIKTRAYILLFLLPIAARAQTFSAEEQIEIDSLNAVVNSPSTEDTTVVEALLNLVDHYFLWDADTSLILSERARNISEKVNYRDGISMSYGWLAYLARSMGNTDLAAEYNKQFLNKAIQLNDIKGASQALSNLGFNYRHSGNVQAAIRLFHESNRLCRQINEKGPLGKNLVHLATIYSEQGKKRTAINTYLEALDLLEEVGDQFSAGYCLINIGYTYAEIESYDTAIYYFKRSIDLREEIGDLYGLIGSLHNLGGTYIKIGAYDSARSCLDRSKTLSAEMNNLEINSTNLFLAAKLSYKTGDLSTAIQQAEAAMKMNLELGYAQDVMSASDLLYSIYLDAGNYKGAYENYKQYIEMRDSLNNLETQAATIEQQTKYQYEKQKALDDLENEQRIAIEQEEKKKQRVILYATIGGLLMLTAFLVFVFSRLRLTRKQNKTISEQKEKVDAAYEELEEKNSEIMDSITYAKRIQSAILPPTRLVQSYIPDSFILYKPKDIVAGDFYWMEPLENEIIFAVADCTGHGVPGAMVSVVCNNGLNRSVREYGLTDPGEILTHTRSLVISEFEKSEEEVKDGMDIALCSLRMRNENEEKDTHSPSASHSVLKYAGAHNPLWIIRKGATEIEEIKADKQPIGKFAAQKPFKTNTVELYSGDSIYIFTDGFADQFGGEKGKKFKGANFKKLLLTVCIEPMEKQGELIDKAFEDWRGVLEQVDDVCVIGVRV